MVSMSEAESGANTNAAASTVETISPPVPLIIRVGFMERKNEKKGPCFGHEYYKGSTGIPTGLDTSATLDQLEAFVKNDILATRVVEPDKEWVLEDHNGSGSCFYCRTDAPTEEIPEKIATTAHSLVAIHDLPDAIVHSSYDAGSRGRILDIVICCKKILKKKRKVTKQTAAAATPAASRGRSDSSVSSSNDPPGTSSSKKRPAKQLGDHQVTLVVQLLRPTETTKEKGKDTTKKAVSDTAPLVTFNVDPLPISHDDASATSASQTSQEEGDEGALVERAARVGAGRLRKEVLTAAYNNTAYRKGGKADGETLVGAHSKIYIRTDKRGSTMTELPSETAAMWNLINIKRKNSQQSTHSIDLSVGAKTDDDLSFNPRVFDDDAVHSFSQSVRDEETVLLSPNNAEEKQSSSSRRSAKQSCGKECREWLKKHVMDEQSPIYASLSREMFDNCCRILGNRSLYLKFKDRAPELSELPSLTGAAGGGCHTDHRIPVKGKYKPNADGTLPSYPESSTKNNPVAAALDAGLDKMGSRLQKGSEAIANAMRELPTSFLLSLKYDGKTFSTIVGQADYEATISAIFKKMQKTYKRQGLLPRDSQDGKGISEKGKEAILSFKLGNRTVEYDTVGRQASIMDLIPFCKTKEGGAMAEVEADVLIRDVANEEDDDEFE